MLPIGRDRGVDVIDSVCGVSCDIRNKFTEILEEVPCDHFISAAKIGKLLDKYTESELELIYHDFCKIRQVTFDGVTKKNDYVVTAGGPASGKSTVLEGLLLGESCSARFFDAGIVRAYIDPDRSCLSRMEYTYKADITASRRSPEEAYSYWREASNYLSNVYLAVALKEGCAIAHGSTMATPYAKDVISSIKYRYGYKTTIIHMTCEETVREASEKCRQEGGVVQCSGKDFREKQALFYTLLGDYVKFSDRVIFCYRGDIERVSWAAKLEDNALDIYEDGVFGKIQEKHDTAVGLGFCKRIFFGFDGVGCSIGLQQVSNNIV